MDKPWYAPRKPDEIVPIPWLHPAAVAHLESIIQPDWSVLEQGAGGSTLWLAERVDRVVSIEGNLDWRQKVRDLAPANVCLLEAIPDGAQPKYDLLFIDGDHPGRGEMLKAACDLVKPGGWIVLDNANRPEYEAERRLLFDTANLRVRFDNNIRNSSYFVTEFWQCASE